MFPEEQSGAFSLGGVGFARRDLVAERGGGIAGGEDNFPDIMNCERMMR